MTATLDLTHAELGQLEQLRTVVDGNDVALDAALSELIQYRAIKSAIHQCRWLMNAKPVRTILNRMPSPRAPRAA